MLPTLPKDMLRKTNSQKGFTIIEVVITIAIGAAVMALVLNAVAGARRSQRNNARSADVNQVAAAVNQYIATRNALPGTWGNIQTIIENGDKFGHYEPGNINTTKIWDNTEPATTGDFAWDTAYTTAPTGGITGSNNDMADSADYIVVLAKAQCATGNKLPAAGGIREMAIVYKLEGQSDTICLEV